MSEYELVERVKQGDPEAFRQLYELHARMVYRYSIVRVGNSQDAEDLTSQVFTKAWQAFPSYRWEGRPVTSWLLRITHNLIIDTYRRKRKLLNWLPWYNDQKEGQIARIDQQDEIQWALTTLSYEQQVILHLHFFEGYNLKEVATFLGKSPNAVRVAQYRALRRLREVIQHDRARDAEASTIPREATSAVTK